MDERSANTALQSTDPTGRHPLTGALLRAAHEGDLEKVSALLQEGVPVNSTNSAGLQALHFAAKSGHLEVACELLKCGASVNAASLKSHTPLHVASLLGRSEIVKLLLRQGADVNIASQCFDDSFTALYMAAQIGQQEIVTLLLAHGANPTLTTKNGSTARDIAGQQGYRAVAELLGEYERRLATDSNTTTRSSASSVAAEDTAAGDASSSTSSSTKTGRMVRRPPAIYNRDVIPSPKNSPLKTCPPLDQLIRSNKPSH